MAQHDDDIASSGGVGTSVNHPVHGSGTVLLHRGATAVVRFAHGIEECPATSLTTTLDLEYRVRQPTWDPPLATVLRFQAECIVSVNDLWGVFSRSRIDLLPHQLWVCRKVIEHWPTRWLVADDVGLGKTVEAGLILWPLLSSGRVRRLLIICPAGLCKQWQIRLREMFDIRVALHDPAVDTPQSDFWNTNKQVIASLQTLRLDKDAAKLRQDRLVESEPWDLVIVDEAHHLNYDEQAGPTLGYKLLQRMVEHKKIGSMIFFTGTPHRGKHFGFLALLQLLRPDLFDAQRPLQEQLPHLRSTLIRNNKSSVTDLRGERLFREPAVSAESYRYSSAEQQFYELLSEFIATGRAYASSLAAGDARTVQLVLIAMQKLASSSVAAIRSAIEGRLERLAEHRTKAADARVKRDAIASYLEAEAEGRLDDLSALDEEIAKLEAKVALVRDEEEHLRALLDAAGAVRSETKIVRLMEVLANQFPDEPVLFFTEYKATQALVMSALMSRFGESTVTFINGDDRVRGVRIGEGPPRTFAVPREEARDLFNSGKARFLVSTEASGEGVDLQEHCSALIHVDLPWNPMRLHQRVGRLNRYGQREKVRVVSLRNPDTVESRIWAKLDEKINNIMLAQSQYMDEPEDLLELVLGMTSPSLFRELFADSDAVPRERLNDWFDAKAARLGGHDILQTVQDLIGNAARFDFQEISEQVPKLDLPDLRPFFIAQLSQNRRRASVESGRLSFKTPDAWLSDPGVRTYYDQLVFDRKGVTPRESTQVIGVGHRAFDQAIRQARSFDAATATVSARLLPSTVVLTQVRDRVTDSGRHVTGTLVGVECDPQGTTLNLLKDWEVLQILNSIVASLKSTHETSPAPSLATEGCWAAAEAARRYVEGHVAQLGLPYSVPEVSLCGVLWPRDSAGDGVEG
jgi:superfamily II DNA or RNA helicase